MKIRVRRSSLRYNKAKKPVIFLTASRYEDGKLQAFSIMTELKGK